jgi:hypothetical protein
MCEGGMLIDVTTSEYPIADWQNADTSISFTTPTDLPGGYYLLTVVANAVPSDGKIVFYQPPQLFPPEAPGGLNTTNVTTNSAFLSWDPVSGANYYTISWGTNEGATNGGTIITTEASYLLSGLTPLTIYYWMVSATNGNGTGPYSYIASFETLSSNTYKTSLLAGYNLYSMPVIPPNISIESVIGSQLNSLSPRIYSYSITNGWSIAFVLGGVWRGSLPDIENDKGYWILVSSATTLEIAGSVSPTDRTIPLKGQKANLVGTAYITTQTMAQTSLDSYLTTSDRVWGYIDNVWKPAFMTGGGWGGALTTFEPGRGYWVIKNSAGDVEWVYPKP